MKTTPFSDFSNNFTKTARRDTGFSRQPSPAHNEPHVLVQLLSVLAFGIFSIVGIVLAFSAFWLVGLVLATMIAWTWARSRTFGGQRGEPDTAQMNAVRDLAPVVTTQRSSGNASFDAYRAEMLQRLERENRAFEEFLTRLRAAADAKEFDAFMDERALSARETVVQNEFETPRETAA